MRPGAAVIEFTDRVDTTGWPPGTRLIVRREPLHPGAQRSLFDSETYRYWGHWTDQGGTPVELDVSMRAHARVEDHIRRLKASGLERFPFADLDANKAWSGCSGECGDALVGGEELGGVGPAVKEPDDVSSAAADDAGGGEPKPPSQRPGLGDGERAGDTQELKPADDHSDWPPVVLTGHFPGGVTQLGEPEGDYVWLAAGGYAFRTHVHLVPLFETLLSGHPTALTDVALDCPARDPLCAQRALEQLLWVGLAEAIPGLPQ